MGFFCYLISAMLTYLGYEFLITCLSGFVSAISDDKSVGRFLHFILNIALCGYMFLDFCSYMSSNSYYRRMPRYYINTVNEYDIGSRRFMEYNMGYR